MTFDPILTIFVVVLERKNVASCLTDAVQASGTSVWWHDWAEWVTETSSILSVSWQEQQCHVCCGALSKSTGAQIILSVFCDVEGFRAVWRWVGICRW